MGSSSAEFSLFLGFGEQTVAKYEAGTLPTSCTATRCAWPPTKEGAGCCSASMAIGSQKASRAKVRKCLGLGGRPTPYASRSTLSPRPFRCFSETLFR